MNEDSPKFRELLSLEREYTLLERNIAEVSKALVTAKRDYENTESLEWKQRFKNITRTLRISRRVPDCDSREIVKEKQHSGSLSIERIDAKSPEWGILVFS